MTQLITHVHEGLRGVNIIARVIDVSTTDSYIAKDVWDKKDKQISRDGWPDRSQERNAFKPHCRSTITRGCCGELLPGAKGAWRR